jgi:hypothetical protein
MRIKAQITPQRTRGSITIVGSYRDKKTDKEKYLLSSGKKVVMVLEEKDRVFQHTFEAGYPLTFSFDDSDFQDLAVIEFWKNHPLVKTDGYENTNFVAEQFIFEIKEEKVRVDYEVLLSKLICVEQVSQMTNKERRDLTFSLGSDPRNMSDKEVYLHLIGLTLSGIAIANRASVSNYLSIRSNERIATIYANKSISYGVVKKEGSVYKIAGRNAGTTIDAVVSLILSDNDMFENYIKPEVDKYEAMEIKNVETVDDLNLPEEIAVLLPVNTSIEKKEARKAGRKKESEE